MNIAVVGQGFVGLTLSVFLASKKYKIFGVENNSKKLLLLKKGKTPFFEPKLKQTLQKCLKTKNLQFVESLQLIFDKIDIIFICVPTPNAKNSIDLKFIKQVINEISKLLTKSNNKPMIAIKSTIAPTTANQLLSMLSKTSKKILGKDFFFVVNPEFLREGSALLDQKQPHLIVIGCEDTRSKNKIENFYKKLYSKEIPILLTNFSTAELIKYSNNAFLATKISFINSVSNLCDKIPGANVDDVAKAIGIDPRIGPYFLNAGPGFGGSCLPKDLTSFISVYKNFDVSPILFQSVKNINEKQLEQIFSLLQKRFNNLSRKTISILGLSFKENSDDLRGSQSIKLIKTLLKNKCRVKVFDTLALNNTKYLFKDNLVYCNDMHDCIQNSDCLIIMNSDSHFKKISKKNIMSMRRKLIIDTRRILNKNYFDKIPELDYIALGINSATDFS